MLPAERGDVPDQLGRDGVATGAERVRVGKTTLYEALKAGPA